MIDLYRNIKLYRLKNNWTQDELAQRVGYSDKSMISRVEAGKIGLNGEQIKKFAEIFGIPAGDLMGDDGLEDRIPVVGRVAAGDPIDAIQDIIDYEPMNPDMLNRGDYFGLRVKGDSMNPRIYDGDVVIVREQDTAENGQIVVCSVNGDDATCKRLIVSDDGQTWLFSLNPSYTPRLVTGNIGFRIYGIVVEIRGKMKGI